MNRTYNLNFDELCRKLMLGELLSPTKPNGKWAWHRWQGRSAYYWNTIG